MIRDAWHINHVMVAALLLAPTSCSRRVILLDLLEGFIMNAFLSKSALSIRFLALVLMLLGAHTRANTQNRRRRPPRSGR